MRLLLSIGAFLFAASFSHAADPQPVWEIDTATKLRSIGVDSVGFSPDGKKLIARIGYAPSAEQQRELLVGGLERVLVWDVATRTKLLSVDLGECSQSFRTVTHAATPAGTLLLPGSKTREIRLSDGKERMLSANRQWASGVGFDRVSRRVIWLRREFVGLAISSGILPPFENDPKQSVPEKWTVTRVEQGDTRAAAVNLDLTRLAVAATEPFPRRRDADKFFIPDSILALYRVEHGDTLKLAEVATIPSPHAGPISVIQFSPDGKTLATGSSDSSVFLWDVDKAAEDWKPRATVSTGRFTVVALAFSPDGRSLAVGTTERQGCPNLYMIDVAADKLVSSRRLSESVSALAFSPDGRMLVTGHNLGTIRVWDAAAVRGD